ncbi:MAG: hypothetical protein HRU15_06365, partial [Planctomycetes bacterium]|nr:hypothetical protein [Planctomycetota bacterium]
MPEEFYDDEEEFLDDEEMLDEDFDDDDDNQVGAAPAWIISLAIHGLLALIMLGIVFGVVIEDEEPPVRVANIEAPPEEEEEEKEERTLEEVEVTIESDVVTDTPIV